MEPKLEAFIVSNYFGDGWSGNATYKVGSSELRVKMPKDLAERLAKLFIEQHKGIEQ